MIFWFLPIPAGPIAPYNLVTSVGPTYNLRLHPNTRPLALHTLFPLINWGWFLLRLFFIIYFRNKDASTHEWEKSWTQTRFRKKPQSCTGQEMSPVRSRRSSAYTGSSCSPGLAEDRCLGSCSGFEVKPTLYCSLSLRNHLSSGEASLDEVSSIVTPATTVSQCSVALFGLSAGYVLSSL